MVAVVAELIIYPCAAKELTGEQNRIFTNSVLRETSSYVARLIACGNGSGKSEVSSAIDVLSKNVGMAPKETIDNILNSMRLELGRIGSIKGTEFCEESQLNSWKSMYERSLGAFDYEKKLDN